MMHVSRAQEVYPGQVRTAFRCYGDTNTSDVSSFSRPPTPHGASYAVPTHENVSPSDYIVLKSDSMLPAIQHGDVLFLTNGDERIRVGEIVVFKIEGRDIPIVHRGHERTRKVRLYIRIPRQYTETAHYIFRNRYAFSFYRVFTQGS